MTADSERERPADGPDTVELCGGPLDGEQLDVSALTPNERATGAALISPRGMWAGGRSLYGPDPADPSRWVWEGDTP